MDKRLNELEAWLADTLELDITGLAPASSDASFRRYFRAHTHGRSLIVMDAPPDKEAILPFIHAADALALLGLHAPELIAYNAARGFVLLEDLGNRTYLDELDEQSADSLYDSALDALVRLQQGHVLCPGYRFPDYDEDLLRQEMDLFDAWYVKRHLQTKLDPAQRTTFETGMAGLIDAALQQPKCWVHRDYHSRNLMIPDFNLPGIIDFQDMVYGPISYDLVSLLKDCYISWPRPRVERWVASYLEKKSHRHGEHDLSQAEFLTWFDMMGVQRHLKVLGIFARLNYRDGKSQFLEDLPLVLEYLLKTCERHESLHDLHRLLTALHA